MWVKFSTKVTLPAHLFTWSSSLGDHCGRLVETGPVKPASVSLRWLWTQQCIPLPFRGLLGTINIIIVTSQSCCSSGADVPFPGWSPLTSLQPQHRTLQGLRAAFWTGQWASSTKLTVPHDTLATSLGSLFLLLVSFFFPHHPGQKFWSHPFKHPKILLLSEHCFPSDFYNSSLYTYDFHPKLSEYPNCSSFQLYPACGIQINLPKSHQDFGQKSPKIAHSVATSHIMAMSYLSTLASYHVLPDALYFSDDEHHGSLNTP